MSKSFESSVESENFFIRSALFNVSSVNLFDSGLILQQLNNVGNRLFLESFRLLIVTVHEDTKLHPKTQSEAVLGTIVGAKQICHLLWV